MNPSLFGSKIGIPSYSLIRKRGYGPFHRRRQQQQKLAATGIHYFADTIETARNNSKIKKVDDRYLSFRHCIQHPPHCRDRRYSWYFISCCGNQSSKRSFSSSSDRSRRRSPYAVLRLRRRQGTTIGKDKIKAAFRKLAKVYHPDLNSGNSNGNGRERSREECESKMSELIGAYERLLGSKDEDGDGFLENIKVGASNKVALACELYSLEELTMDRFHEVYALEIDYSGSSNEEKPNDNGEDNGNDNDNDDSENSNGCPGEDVPSSETGSLPVSVTTLTYPVKAHPGDSVLDLKEDLEAEFGADWGLRECLGWELLAVTTKQGRIRGDTNPNNNNHKNGDDDGDDDDPSIFAANNVVMSYHLFLDDYQIKHGDTIYAVVRKNDD